MSLKSLLKSAAASNRLAHPFAKYDRLGKLSCSLCSVPVKHEELWASHLISKGHRARERAAREAEEKAAALKAAQEDEEPARKRARVELEEDATGGLPADFGGGSFQLPVTATEEPEPAAQEEELPDDLADELAAFDAELATLPAPAAGGPSASLALPAPGQGSATIFGAPVEYEFGAPRVAAEDDEEAADGQEEEEEETEEERKEREEREEREELLERIMEEEREQKEADSRVDALKRKMELLKAAREAKKKAAA